MQHDDKVEPPAGPPQPTDEAAAEAAAVAAASHHGRDPVEAPTPPPVPQASFLTWLKQGWRVATLRAPDWDLLDARPTLVATLLMLSYLLSFGLQWALIDGPARFYWTAILNGWAATVVMLWLGWVVSRSSAASAGRPRVSPATLLALATVAGLVQAVVVCLVALALMPALGAPHNWTSPSVVWTFWLVPMLYALVVIVRLLWRVAGTPASRLAIVLLAPVVPAIHHWLQPVYFWWPAPPAAQASEEPAPVGLPLTEEVLAAQPRLMAQALAALQPPQPERINVYAVTYAPYADEDVFMRESAVVAKTMAERFDAGSRTVQLVLNPATATRLPWATHTHLRQTLRHLARLMDRERDVLFIHLTSHGAQDGELAADGWPLEVQPLTADLLKQWLDEAGIRWRVLSVSACYSGTWIEPLANDDTLVMSASDATHTSYGCGKKSPLTFFGQALYVDALKDRWSFTEAHAHARQLIEMREREAGKTDYSNPQIREGAAIADVLRRLAAQQRQAAPVTSPAPPSATGAP